MLWKIERKKKKKKIGRKEEQIKKMYPNNHEKF